MTVEGEDAAWAAADVSLSRLEHAVEHTLRLTPTAQNRSFHAGNQGLT
jgi:hypothetical protein